MHVHILAECGRLQENIPWLNYTDINKNTCILSSAVTDIMAKEV